MMGPLWGLFALAVAGVAGCCFLEARRLARLETAIAAIDKIARNLDLAEKTAWKQIIAEIEYRRALREELKQVDEPAVKDRARQQALFCQIHGADISTSKRAR